MTMQRALWRIRSSFSCPRDAVAVEGYAQLQSMPKLYARLRHERPRCHMHDVSWGSLGEGGVRQAAQD